MGRINKRPDKEMARKMGALLRRAREYRGLTMEEMADKLGYKTVQSYEHFEAGRSMLSFAQVVQISDIFEIPIEEIFPSAALKEKEDTPTGAFTAFSSLYRQIVKQIKEQPL